MSDESARTIGDLKAVIERVADHRWIIATAYVGGNFGWQVNTRDEPSHSKESQTYTARPETFALTAPDAGLNGLRLPTPTRS